MAVGLHGRDGLAFDVLQGAERGAHTLHGNNSVAFPRQGVEDHDSPAGYVDRTGQGAEFLVQDGADEFFGRADVIGVRFPGGLQPFPNALFMEFLPLLAVADAAAPLGILRRSAPSVLAVEKALLIGVGHGRTDVFRRHAPGAEFGMERVGGGNEQSGVARGFGAQRIGHQAMNPGVGHVAADHRHVDLVGRQRIGKIRHPANLYLDARPLVLHLLQHLFDVFRRRRALVVVGVQHGQPRRIGPVLRRKQTRAILGAEHRQQSRAVGPFPPEQQRRLSRRDSNRCTRSG